MSQSLDALYARSQTARLNEVDIRILAAEDHLVVLIRHFLRHNAWRPLWLCDIAAVLESRPPDFDWDRCLGGNRRHAGWVACTLGLAHRLLDADVENTPVADRANHLPSWLVPAVLRQWDRCVGAGERRRVVRYIASHWRHPMQILGEACERWDMPIAATVALGGPFNEFPRLPFQLGLALSHVPHLVSGTGKLCEGAVPISGRPIVATTGRRPRAVWETWAHGASGHPCISVYRSHPHIDLYSCISLNYMMNCPETIELLMAVWYCAV